MIPYRAQPEPSVGRDPRRKAIREIGSSQGSSAPVYGFAELSRLMGFEEGVRAAPTEVAAKCTSDREKAISTS
jgi:hypothetical protein